MGHLANPNQVFFVQTVNQIVGSAWSQETVKPTETKCCNMKKCEVSVYLGFEEMYIAKMYTAKEVAISVYRDESVPNKLPNQYILEIISTVHFSPQIPFQFTPSHNTLYPQHWASSTPWTHPKP